MDDHALTAFWLGFQAGLALGGIVLVLLGTCVIARRLQEAAALCDELLNDATRGSAVRVQGDQRVRDICLPLPPDDRVVMVRGMMLPLYEN